MKKSYLYLPLLFCAFCVISAQVSAMETTAILNNKSQKTASTELKRAYFAGGCFWGVEYYLEKIPGVKSVVSGFMGGTTKNPGYYDVVRGDTGHLETVAVTYDPSKVGYKTLAKTFFEIHDPTQEGRQGPDVGAQYQSAIFYNDAAEKETAMELIKRLRKNGYDVKTKLIKASAFYKAEAYHQDYYERHHKQPYCHGYVKRFKDD